jgi:hypothetical protein
MPSGNYKKVAELINNWIALNASPGFKFEPKAIFEHYRNEITTQEQKNDVLEVLWHLVHKKGNLEKIGSIYKYLNINTNNSIPWVDADETEIFPFVWPSSHQDGSEFTGTEGIMISPGDLIVLGGETNKGKTAMCLNFLWDNMEYKDCVLMGQEYYPSKFKRRVKNMTWVNPLDDDNKPKFELLKVRDDWKYNVRPDKLNIIDWISLETDFFRIGAILDGIQDRLKKGIAIVSLQKGEGKSQAVGGHFSEDLASVYITMHDGYCIFKKVKEVQPHTPNLSGRMFAYDIVDGVHFCAIREVRRCPKCNGLGRYRSGDCDGCRGKGIVDKAVEY